MKNFQIKKGHLMTAALILALWTLLALLFTPDTYLANVPTDPSFTLWRALVANFGLFYVWALLTPPILWLSRHFPVGRRRLLRNLSVHFVMGFVFAFAHLVMLRYANSFLLNRGISNRMALSIWFLFINVGAFNVAVYWGTLAVSQAVIYFRKYQEREYRLAQAQLQTLSAQLQPHFLFNTLNAIAELVYSHPEIADRTLAQLSDLLRLSLAGGRNHEVSLKEELDFLKKYTEIQQTLLQERLRVRFEVEPETLDASVPNMILQPLIENSIRHGIAPKSCGGQIDVRAERRDGMLHLQVQDDGAGISAGGKGIFNGGIGLANTRARLECLYHDTQRFEAGNAPGGGFEVSITIPFREKLTEPEYEETRID